jgi:hypothetical protein
LFSSHKNSTVEHELDNELLENPERGFYRHLEIELPVSNLNSIRKDWKAQFSGWKKNGVTLVLIKFAIRKFVRSDFKKPDTDAMTAAFEELRSLGMKAIVRYSYVVCEKKISKTKTEFEFQEDAKKDQLLAHIKQVTPILKVTFISK